jgi:thiosulfate/3-mercaptopyruvate sulfurtransferase
MGVRPLVTTDWLNEHLHDADVRILDASWYLPGDPRDPRAEYALIHIPGAGFFDIDEVADTETNLPHMLPPPETFAEAVQKLGVGNEHFVVIYDAVGIYSSPRLLWTFHTMGHETCAVLDGGLAKWRSENRPTTSQAPPHRPAMFSPALNREILRECNDLLSNLKAKNEQVLDARSPSRFAGLEQEPRPGVKPGHIPASVNIHYAELKNNDGTLRSAEDLRSIFEKRTIDLGSPIVTTCGSGITAAIVYLAAKIAGATEVALYDGSWADWGSMVNAPIEIGP